MKNALNVFRKFMSYLVRYCRQLNEMEHDPAIEKLYDTNEDVNIKFIGSKTPNIKIGTGTYINGVEIYCWDERIDISIGRYCSIADKITIIAGGEHETKWVSTYPFIPRWKVLELYPLQQPRFKGDIKIGNDVWIANNVVIMSGVTISDGAVVGAGSVVKSDIPSYCIAVGNPARAFSKRFSDEVIVRLNRIKWWDWDRGKISDNLYCFNDIDEFIKKHDI